MICIFGSQCAKIMDTTNNTSKPDWLKALEAQSWQAELIASGLAIYGSLSLGNYIDDITQWLIPRFSDRTLGILYFAFLYVYAAHALLVISFITHLSLRILWAGILGLSSVYPQGINVESKSYSPSFLNRLKQEFPDLSDYSLKLDRLCSLIFSILCAMVMVMASITFWILIYLILSELLVRIVPYQTIDKIGLILIGILLLVSTFGGILTQTGLKDTKLAKRLGYPLVMGMGSVVYLFGYRPINFILQTIRTNVTNKLFFIGMMGIFVISLGSGMPRFFPMVPYFISDIWTDYRAHPSQSSSEHYLDDFKKTIILEPIIQSRTPKESYLDLFIPRYKREEKYRSEICDEYSWDDDLSRFENRNLRDEFRTWCAQQYYQLEMDGKVIPSPDFRQIKHPHQEEVGYQVFLPIDTLPQGRHILTIKSLYQSNQDSTTFLRSIPFYKVE